MNPDKNANGDYFLYDKGKIVGTARMDMIDGHMVTGELKPKIVEMQRAASADGVILTVDSGFRTFSQQYETRKAHVIDKSKVNDEHYLLTADNGAFNPRTAIPGTSNHQDGTAVDFRTKDPQTGQLLIGPHAPYQWLVKNALRFSFVRTVPSERWHWEYRPAMKDMFAIIPQNHPSWDGLV